MASRSFKLDYYSRYTYIQKLNYYCTNWKSYKLFVCLWYSWTIFKIRIFAILWKYSESTFSEVTEGEAKPAEPEPVKHPEVDKAALKEQVKSNFKGQVKSYFKEQVKSYLKEQVKSNSVLRTSQFVKLFCREGVTIPIFTSILIGWTQSKN